MSVLLFDTETNGLLDTLDTIHCLVIKNPETKRIIRLNKRGGTAAMGGAITRTRGGIEEGLEILAEADTIVAHNALGFDIPAIQMVYPGWTPPRVIDSLVMTRLNWPEIRGADFQRIKRDPDFPKQLIGRHSLEAWGHRLKLLKGDYSAKCKAKGIDPWAEWSREMEDYCEQDVHVLAKLWAIICKKGYAPQAVDIEHRFQSLILKQEAHGWPFDVKKAQKLSIDLNERSSIIEDELQVAFPPEIKPMKMTWWHTPDGKQWETKKAVVEAGNKAKTVEKGAFRTKEVPFNPSSRDHIARRLTDRFGWKPKVFTGDGKPKVDEAVLSDLAKKFPEAKLLQEYLMLDKRLSALSNGKEAWLKHEKNGRIHGRVNTLGAVNRRCTHSKPNITQLPTIHAPWGWRCRELVLLRFSGEHLLKQEVFYGARNQVYDGVQARGGAPRAFSDHSGSYPELAKKLAHSVGVKSSMISAMASHRSSTVRAAAFLSRALSLAKACSMGLKSGE